jgi:hypothetical protein
MSQFPTEEDSKTGNKKYKLLREERPCTNAALKRVWNNL